MYVRKKNIPLAAHSFSVLLPSYFFDGPLAVGVGVVSARALIQVTCMSALAVGPAE